MFEPVTDTKNSSESLPKAITEASIEKQHTIRKFKQQIFRNIE